MAIAPQVFINCPFDTAFGPRLDALLFTCVCCGYLPVTALSSGSSGRARMDRILRTLIHSPYSIHDLSRCRGEGGTNLARFNMPLELGVAMCLGHLDDQNHEWMALVPSGVSYQQYVSDLSGYDLEVYEENIETIISRVTAWLLTRDAALDVPYTPKQIAAALRGFMSAKIKERKQWFGGDLPMKVLIRLARDNVPQP